MTAAPPCDVSVSVLRRCRELGFALAGICRAEPSAYGGELWRWLQAGRHGEMHDPALLLPEAKSIICVADRYHDGRPDRLPVTPGAPAIGRVARYARGGDYHVVIRKRLKQLAAELEQMAPGERFRVCVDTAPILEREHAMRARLGAVGKHTLLIGAPPGTGSWLLLGEVISTLSFTPQRRADDHVPDAASGNPSARDSQAIPAKTPADGFSRCGTCTRCIDAYPTAAITPGSVDATRCISYLTIEHRGLIDPSLHAAMGDWIFGCDICQEVCPHNQPTRQSRRTPVHPAYQPRGDRTPGLDLLAVLAWTEADRRAAFAGSPMKRASLAMLQRNALIAAGNAHIAAGDTQIAAGNALTVAGDTPAARPDPALLARLRQLAADPAQHPLVQGTAHAVLARLKRES
jgi:epoxyqueuosine reductase